MEQAASERAPPQHRSERAACGRGITARLFGCAERWPDRSYRRYDRRLRYATPVLPNEPVEDCAPFGQPFERAGFISAHEAAVALNIRCEDCDEASADCSRV